MNLVLPLQLPQVSGLSQTGCHATFATIGAVPVGEATWLHYNGNIWVERKLKCQTNKQKS